MYEVCKLLIIKYIFAKNDSSTRTNIRDLQKGWIFEDVSGANTDELFAPLIFYHD